MSLSLKRTFLALLQPLGQLLVGSFIEAFCWLSFYASRAVAVAFKLFKGRKVKKKKKKKKNGLMQCFYYVT